MILKVIVLNRTYMACSKNSPQKESQSSTNSTLCVFLLLFGIFSFLFQSHSPLCSFKKKEKPVRLKGKNTTKVIFRTCHI